MSISMVHHVNSYPLGKNVIDTNAEIVIFAKMSK